MTGVQTCALPIYQVSQITANPKLESFYNDILDGYADFEDAIKAAKTYIGYLDENGKAKLKGLIDLAESLKRNPFKIYASADLVDSINKLTADLDARATDLNNDGDIYGSEILENINDSIHAAHDSILGILQNVDGLTSAISLGNQLVTSQFSNQEAFYRAFPGIDSVENGIFDPYKPIAEFTESELKNALIPTYMSESDFKIGRAHV